MNESHERYSRYERIYLVLAATFITVLLLTNIIGIKLFQAPFNATFALTTGIITYPITFLMTDVVSEIYGHKRANFMVFLGFFLSLLMLAIIQIALHVAPHHYWAGSFFADLSVDEAATAEVDPADDDSAGDDHAAGKDDSAAASTPTLAEGETAHELILVTGTAEGLERTTVKPVDAYQHGFESVFALNGLLLFGSMLAYLVAQLIDVRLYHFWKRLTKGRYLWLRNNGSTWVSQLVDTAIVNSILFYLGFKMDFWIGLEVMATIYVYKLILAAIDTPFIYLGVYLCKRMLGYRWDEDVQEARAAGAIA